MSIQGARGTPNGRVPAGPVLGGNNKSKQIKLVLLGESGVGKSSIALRFVRGEFNENGEATIGAAFLTKTINCQNVNIKFDIWDTAGQERYHSLAPMYYRGAQASIVVYDVTSKSSYHKATQWVKELLQQAANNQMIIVLVGNKADMVSNSRDVQRDEARDFAETNQLIFAESSAKTGMNVEDIFTQIGNTVASQSQPSQQQSGGNNVKLDNQTKKEGGCC